MIGGYARLISDFTIDYLTSLPQRLIDFQID